MKSHEIYSCRRKALRLTKEQIAIKANVLVQYVEWFEEGKRIPTWAENNIKVAIRNEFCNLTSIEHYRARILELAIEIRDETEVTYALNEISHMMIELGKLQNELLGMKPKTKEEWGY